MEHKGYIAHIEFDDEANIFHGEVVNIRDVITFQGESVGKLRKAFEDSIEDYLEFCAKRGEQPNLPFTGVLTVQLSPSQYRRAIQVAEKHGKDVRTWAAETLERAVAS